MRYGFLLLIFLCFASVSPPADGDEMLKFRQLFREFINDPAFAHASVGFCLVDTESGKTAFEYNSGQSLIPASVLKIVTTGAALGILGEDFTFKTEISYDSVSGNIYIIGGGDPTLGADRVKGAENYDDVIKIWIDTLQKVLKNRPVSAIFADAGRYETALQPKNRAWNDIGNYYGAGASGLSFHENYYTISLNAAAKTGGAVEIEIIIPEIDHLKFNNELTAGPQNSGDNAYIFGAPYNFNYFIRGTIPAASRNFTIKGAIPNPPLFCAQQLYKAFFAKGIYVAKSAEVIFNSNSYNKNNLQPVYTNTSPPLKDIIYHTNLKSINLYAEHLLKECGFRIFKTGTTEAGVKAVKQYWQDKGIETDGFFMEDGSGLSQYNAITASQLTQILAAAKKELWFNSFYNSLPVAGESGAMRNIGAGTAIAGKMHAKTGHINRIRSYAGFSGKYTFALLVNNYTCSSFEIKTKIGKILAAMDF